MNSVADVAKAALRTLLRGTGMLGPDQLQALLVRCSQCEMGAEIKAFASRIVTDGTGASPETSSLVAALVNDPVLAHSTLRASGKTRRVANWGVASATQDAACRGRCSRSEKLISQLIALL